MKPLYRNIFVLFLLAIFAFPFVQRELHRHEHKNEVHCKAITENHFHEFEQECKVCDFTLPTTDDVSEKVTSVNSDSSTFKYQGFTQQIIYFFVEQFFLQRAPPVSAQ